MSRRKYLFVLKYRVIIDIFDAFTIGYASC
jgi:hypothetical protein